MIDIAKLLREVVGSWRRDGYVEIRGRNACALLDEVKDSRRKLQATLQTANHAYALLAADDRLQIETEHWVHGSDEGPSYCWDCATKEVERLKADDPEGDYCVDGGWGGENDGPRDCETCGVALDHGYTDHACVEEIEHCELYGLDLRSPSACYGMRRVLDAGGHTQEAHEIILRAAAREVRRYHLWLWRAGYLREREEQERRRELAEVAGWAPLVLVSLREERDRLYRQLGLWLWRAEYLREQEVRHG